MTTNPFDDQENMDDYSRAQRALNTEVAACKEDYARAHALAGSRTAEDIENAVTAKKVRAHFANMPTTGRHPSRLTAVLPAELRAKDEERGEASHRIPEYPEERICDALVRIENLTVCDSLPCAPRRNTRPTSQSRARTGSPKRSSQTEPSWSRSSGTR